MRKPKVLFLSTENAARSQMAEAFLRHQAAERFDAFSAGLMPTAIHPLTRQVMDEIGVSLAEQRAKDVSEYLGQMHFGYLVTVCSSAEQNCPTAFLGLGNRLYWELDDPVKFTGDEAAQLQQFRAVRDEIARRLQDWLESTS